MSWFNLYFNQYLYYNDKAIRPILEVMREHPECDVAIVKTWSEHFMDWSCRWTHIPGPKMIHGKRVVCSQLYHSREGVKIWATHNPYIDKDIIPYQTEGYKNTLVAREELAEELAEKLAEAKAKNDTVMQQLAVQLNK